MGTYGWTEGTLFGFSYDKKNAENQKLNTFGHDIKVVIPLEIGGNLKEYTFSFMVKEPIN